MCTRFGEDYNDCSRPLSLLPSLPPSLPVVPNLHRGYVAAGLDKKEISFEVDDKILS